MTNAYTVTTNFGAKDSLASGNPAKLILGAQFTTEFTNLFNALANLTVANPPTWQSGTGTLFNVTDGTDNFRVSNVAGNVTVGTSSNSILTFATNGSARGAISATGAWTMLGGLAVSGGVFSSRGISDSSATTALTIASTGAFTFAAPASGTALTINAQASASYIAQFLSPGSTAAKIALSADAGTVGTNSFDIYQDTSVNANLSQLGAFGMNFLTNSSVRLAISSTGNLTLNASSVNPTLTVTGPSGDRAVAIRGNATVGNSYGFNMSAGTNSSDQAFVISNAASTQQYLLLDGAGSLVVGGATGGAQGLGTVNATGYYINGTAAGVGTTGSFTAGTTGLSGGTAACNWTKVGTQVTLYMARASTITSTLTTFTLTGLPSTIQPTTPKYAVCPTLGLNNSALTPNVTALVSGSTIAFGLTGNVSAWTASGTKTIGDASDGAVFVWDTN